MNSLVPFWDHYKIEGKIISEIRQLRDKHHSINNGFWPEFVSKCKSDFKFNIEINLLLWQIKSAPIKMKCFTEIRDNQKINPEHAGYFGSYGVLMKEDWLLKNNGCPVIYVHNTMSLTNIIGINFSILQTLDHCIRKLANIKGMPIHHGHFFDFMSFVETSAHRYEY